MKRGNTGRAWFRSGLVALGAMVMLAATHGRAETPRLVEIREFHYSPPVLIIRRGTTVRWVNHDEETHTVTSAMGAFASAGLANEETFAQTFTTPGTYRYFCALHPHMKATVVVK